MTNDTPTDERAAEAGTAPGAEEVAALLAFLRGRLLRRAARDARRLDDDDEADGRVRTISTVVIALERIMDMEDRCDDTTSPDEAERRRRVVDYVRKHLGRIVALPDDDYRRELARLGREAQARAGDRPGLSGAGAGDVAGDRA